MNKIILIIVSLIAAMPAMASEDLIFPIINSQNVPIGNNIFKISLYETNDKSLSGFVFSVHRDSFLLQLGLIDGNSPSIISPQKYGWPNNVAGIRFGQGGHEKTIKYFALQPGEVKEIGTISSNSSCIYQRPEKNSFIESIDEDKGKITLSTYKIEKTAVRKIKEISLATEKIKDVRRLCADYNLK